MNEVTIVVKAENDTARTFAVIRGEARRAGEDTGKVYTSSFKEQTTRIQDSITEKFRTVLTKVRNIVQTDSSTVGDDLGEGIGRRARDRITTHLTRVMKEKIKVKTDVDVDDASLSGKARTFGGRIADWMHSGLESSVGSWTSGDIISLLVKGIAGAGLTAALLVPLSTAVNAAVSAALGGGVIAAGIVSAFKDPRIMAAGNTLKDELGQIFTDFGKPFQGPVFATLQKLSEFVRTLNPQIQELGNLFAPIVGELGTGFVAMLQNAMPGIMDAIKGSAPLFRELAEHMPQIGQALGDFFRDMGEHGPEVATFFGDMLTAVEKLIGVLGRLISFFAGMYGAFRELAKVFLGAIGEIRNGFQGLRSFVKKMFGEMLDWAVNALGWIPGLGPKLKTAQRQYADYAKSARSSIGSIKGKTVTVTIRQAFETVGNIVGNVGSILSGRAMGGIVGAATGGIRNGLTWVGEHGPELVKLPSGSAVHSNPDSIRMAGSGGGAMDILMKLDPGAAPGLMAELMKALRLEIRTEGGNVQKTLGVVGA